MESTKTFRIQSKHIFLTWAQCNVSIETALARCVASALVLNRKIVGHLIAQENHKDGNPHLHGYLELDKKLDNAFNAGLFDLPPNFHAHIEAAKSPKLCIGYCAKDGTYTSNIPDVVIKRYVEQHKKKEASMASKKRKEISEGLMSGEISLKEMIEKNPEELINLERWKKNLKVFKELDNTKIKDLETMDNLWIWGPSGCGKSTWVAKAYPNRFIKNNSVWWNGYNYEDTVEMQDVDAGWKEVFWMFKVWVDKWKFNARITASDPMLIRPKRIIVTSNYTVEEWLEMCGQKDAQLIIAVTRRFEQVTVDLLPNPNIMDEPVIPDDINELSNGFSQLSTM